MNYFRSRRGSLVFGPARGWSPCGNADSGGMDTRTESNPDERLLIRKVIHRVNNLAAVVMTEAELALLLGTDSERTAALRKVVGAVEEMREFIRAIQDQIPEENT